MRILGAIVLALILIGAGYAISEKLRKEPDPINAILTQMKTRAEISHERWVSVWYRACPKVTGRDPKMLVTWAAQLNYKLPLDELKIDIESADDGTVRLKVKAPSIEAREPTVPSDWVDALSTRSLFTMDESALVDAEKGRASPIARYLTELYLRGDSAKSIELEVRKELSRLLADLSGVLGLKVSSVDIAMSPVAGPLASDFPEVPLCSGSAPTINGAPLKIARQAGVLQSSDSLLELPGRFPTLEDARELFLGNAVKRLELPPIQPSLGIAYGSVDIEYPADEAHPR